MAVGNGGFFQGVATNEPAPVRNERASIQDLVIADLRRNVGLEGIIGDIEARKQLGIKKYGTALQPFNGRNAMMDAYQEALDLVMYLRQVCEEGADAADAYDDALCLAIRLRRMLPA